MLPGLFDEQFLLRKLDQMGVPLARLDGIVDGQAFPPTIEKALDHVDATFAGRKPYPTLLMFNILIFLSLYNLSDEDTERELLKNLLARRFVGLSGRQFGPAFTTIWRFREASTRAASSTPCTRLSTSSWTTWVSGHQRDRLSMRASCPRPNSATAGRKMKSSRQVCRLQTGAKRSVDKRMWTPAGRKRTNRGILATRTTSRWM